MPELHGMSGLEKGHHSLAGIIQNFQMKKHSLNWERGFQVLLWSIPAKQQSEAERDLLDLYSLVNKCE